MRRNNDTELIQRGEAGTEFNDNASTIFRLDQLKRQANMARAMYNYEGLIMHMSAIRGMEQELAGKLTEKEIESIERVTIKGIPVQRSLGNNTIYKTKDRLEQYELVVRELLQKKGMGVTAKVSKDPAKAILGEE